MRAVAVAFAALAFFVAPGYAQVPGSFDHFSTGFPLTGAHARVDCAACHVSGRFKGTPQQCAACHNGTLAQGKISQHPRTSNLCEQCHVTNDWKQVRVDHAGIMGDCATCHNGTIAVGKGVNHPPTNAPCETCHKNTVSYGGAAFNHAEAMSHLTRWTVDMSADAAAFASIERLTDTAAEFPRIDDRFAGLPYRQATWAPT